MLAFHFLICYSSNCNKVAVFPSVYKPGFLHNQPKCSRPSTCKTKLKETTEYEREKQQNRLLCGLRCSNRGDLYRADTGIRTNQLRTNTAIIPWVLRFAYGSPDLIPVAMVTVGIGEILAIGVLGNILLLALERYKNILFGRCAGNAAAR